MVRMRSSLRWASAVVTGSVYGGPGVGSTCCPRHLLPRAISWSCLHHDGQGGAWVCLAYEHCVWMPAW